MSTTAIILALGLGSIVLFSTIFLVILIMMRNRWQQLGDSNSTPRQPKDHSDA
jgi:hypothetical protein